MKRETNKNIQRQNSKSRRAYFGVFQVSGFGFQDASGQALLTTVVFFLIISGAAVFAVSTVALSEVRVARGERYSSQAYIVAESGMEDLVWRIKNNKQYGSNQTLTIDGASAAITVTTSGSTRTVESSGDVASRVRSVKAVVKTGVGAEFNYGVQVGDGGVTMDNHTRVDGSIFSNGSITGGSDASTTGNAIVAVGVPTDPSVEWITHNANNNFATSSVNRDIAQSFIANTGGAFGKVSVYMGKTGSPSDITLRVTADNGGTPSRSDIASVTIPASSVGLTPSWIDAFFSSPPTLTNGSKYWIVLDYNTNSVFNYWNWRKDTSDGYAGNMGKYTADWNDRNAVWTNVDGDLAFRVWTGIVVKKIESVSVGSVSSGVAYADTFVNATVHGLPCPNQYCITDQPQSPKPMPISDGVIQDFRNDAIAGGTIVGDYSVTSSGSLGPKEITGNLLLDSNNKTLTVTGTIYVHGNISIDNGSTARCSASLADKSCAIVSDGWIHIKNNSVFSGSGQAGSYLMLLSTLACDGTSAAPPCDTAEHNGAIDLHNNAVGAIFYASRGLLNLHNGVGISEATAYKLSLGEHAVVTYEQGLVNVNFAFGPTGGWKIQTWVEAE